MPDHSTTNAIVRHIPQFVDVSGIRKQVDFSMLSELVNIPFVKSWSAMPGFHRFCQSGGDLIAEFYGGRSWYVVGYLREPVPNLPE